MWAHRSKNRRGPARQKHCRPDEAVLNNLKVVLEEAGSGLDNVVKVLSFLADIRDFDEYNEAYGEFFKRDGNAPARSTIEARLWGGIGVEIEMVAYIPDK